MEEVEPKVTDENAALLHAYQIAAGIFFGAQQAGEPIPKAVIVNIDEEGNITAEVTQRE